MKRFRRRNAKRGEVIAMVLTSVVVLGALTVTGLYIKNRNEAKEQDGYYIDFDALEAEMDSKVKEADVVSRSVAKDDSYQKFDSQIIGNAKCSGHTECDAIIMGNARILAIPQLEANNIDAALIHEAAIGKIAGEQIIKLMTLGLTEEEAEAQIVNGFLK